MKKYYGKEDNLYCLLLMLNKKYIFLNNPDYKDFLNIYEEQNYVFYFSNLKDLEKKKHLIKNENSLIFCNEKIIDGIFLSDDLIIKKCEDFFNIILDKEEKEKVLLMNNFNKQNFFNIFEKIKLLGKDFFYLNEIVLKKDPIYLAFSFYNKTNNEFFKACVGEALRSFLTTGINYMPILQIILDKIKKEKEVNNLN